MGWVPGAEITVLFTTAGYITSATSQVCCVVPLSTDAARLQVVKLTGLAVRQNGKTLDIGDVAIGNVQVRSTWPGGITLYINKQTLTGCENNSPCGVSGYLTLSTE